MSIIIFLPPTRVLRIKKKTIKQLLKKAEKSEFVFLAPDPDREGEAISWHLAELLAETKSPDKLFRITFNEITKKAIQGAIQNPGKIDMALVNAQQARRILDRLVGYKISPILTRLVTRNSKALSAGRVQSVALRLVCEREEEIRNFIQVEYWTLLGSFHNKNKVSINAELFSYDGRKITHLGDNSEIPDKEDSENGDKSESNFLHIQTEEQANEILKALKGKSSKIEKVVSRKRSRKAPPPLYHQYLTTRCIKNPWLYR